MSTIKALAATTQEVIAFHYQPGRRVDEDERTAIIQHIASINNISYADLPNCNEESSLAFHDELARIYPEPSGLLETATHFGVELSTHEYEIISLRAWDLSDDLLPYWFDVLALQLIGEKVQLKRDRAAALVSKRANK